MLTAVVAQWIRRLATDQKIGGSTPPVGELIFGILFMVTFLGVFEISEIVSIILVVFQYCFSTQMIPGSRSKMPR